VLEGQKKTKTRHSLYFETSDIWTVPAPAKDIPQQKNSYDCGFFTIWYFKVLLQSPDDLVDGLLQGKVNEEIWLNMTASKMREDSIQTILDLLKEQGIDVVVMETGTASEPSSPSPPQSDLESPFRWEYRKRKSSRDDGEESLPTTDSHSDEEVADIGDRDLPGESNLSRGNVSASAFSPLGSQQETKPSAPKVQAGSSAPDVIDATLVAAAVVVPSTSTNAGEIHVVQDADTTESIQLLQSPVHFIPLQQFSVTLTKNSRKGKTMTIFIHHKNYHD
jgi:hypothetical protein